MPETGTTNTAGPEDVGSVSLEEFAGESFGDYSAPSEPAAPASTTPGTPGASAASAASTSADPEGTTTSAPPATPAVAPPTAAPDTTPTAVGASGVAGVATDPLATAQPFSYQVDGQTRTFDGIRVLGEDGAIVEPQALATLAQRLSEHEHLVSANRDLYGRVQEYEGLGGQAKLQELEIANAEVNASSMQLLQALADPAFVQALAFAYQEGKQDDAKRLLAQVATTAQEKGRVATLEKQLAFRDGTTKQQTEQQQVQAVEGQRARGMQSALQRIQEKYPQFTASDLKEAQAYLVAHRNFLFRPATPAEAQAAGVKPGEVIIDYPTIGVWTEQRSAWVAAQKATATTTTQATKENAERLAAAARGVKPTVAAPVAPKKERVPDTRAADADAGWDLMERLTGASLRASQT